VTPGGPIPGPIKRTRPGPPRTWPCSFAEAAGQRGVAGRSRRAYRDPLGVPPRRPVLDIVEEAEVTVVALDTGEILSAHRIEPDKGYWRNTRRDPRPMAGVPDDRMTTGVTHDATHVSPMSRLKTLARPEGFDRTPPTFEVDGVAELVEALRAE